MGSSIEINDTLKLQRGVSFPKDIKLGNKYEFTISDKRLYHLSPVRVFLVEEIDGLWNYIGHAMILELTIDPIKNETRGIYEIVNLYSDEYRILANKYESPPLKGYYPNN